MPTELAPSIDITIPAAALGAAAALGGFVKEALMHWIKFKKTSAADSERDSYRNELFKWLAEQRQIEADHHKEKTDDLRRIDERLQRIEIEQARGKHG